MSLTPGYILTDDMGCVGVTLPELAVILAEWDAAHHLPREQRSDRDWIEVSSHLPKLTVAWAHPKSPALSVTRGDECVYVEDAADIAEMRAILASQGAA